MPPAVRRVATEMQRKLQPGPALALFAALSGATFPLSSAAVTDNDAPMAQVKALAERLEPQSTQLHAALTSDQTSEAEPELAIRLQTTETQQPALQGPCQQIGRGV